MAKRIRSAKGEIVDFDLLTIKQQIAGNPNKQPAKMTEEPPMQIKRPENFIDKKTKRKIAKTTQKTTTE